MAASTCRSQPVPSASLAAQPTITGRSAGELPDLTWCRFLKVRLLASRFSYSSVFAAYPATHPTPGGSLALVDL